MQITVRLAASALRSLGPGRPTATEAALGPVGGSGLELVPVHPGTADPDLASWFVVEVDDAEAGEAVERLRRSPAVEAAYVKPPDALP